MGGARLVWSSSTCAAEYQWKFRQTDAFPCKRSGMYLTSTMGHNFCTIAWLAGRGRFVHTRIEYSRELPQRLCGWSFEATQTKTLPKFSHFLPFFRWKVIEVLCHQYNLSSITIISIEGNIGIPCTIAYCIPQLKLKGTRIHC